MIKELQDRIRDDKNHTEFLILKGIEEILTPLYAKTLKYDYIMNYIPNEMETYLKALQVKNKIYDYVHTLEYNEITKKYEGKIAYSLYKNGIIKEEDNEHLIQYNF